VEVDVEAAAMTTLPLLGRIAAGTPIEALRDPSSFIDVPSGMTIRSRCYALEVDGDSMVDAGILDGDTVIIAEAEHGRTGDIVVALIDDEEVTLKRLRNGSTTITLEPANQDYAARQYPLDRVRIQGRLIGLLRQY
jgi:repressor LexA